MTSRHQNITPPDQINQQRHVNPGVSTPPPPPQFFSAYQPNLEYPIQQQPPALYKAYGSVVNESRAPSNGARVGPPQPNLQTGASFYSQPNQNMRPPQPQQPPATQQYFISTPAQPGLRPRQQQMAPQPAMVYIQQYNQGNNVVIPNMYAPRYPVYQPQPTQGYSTYPAMYYNNGWPNPGIPQATAPIRPPQAREKRIISITDPESGRNITDEIINNRQHSVDSEEHSEDMPAVNPSNQEICKIFTRLVADRLKPPEETNSVTDAQSGAVGASSASVQSSQYQQPPPQQVQQANPAHAAATLIRPNMPMMRPDLTQPPPQIRQSTPAPLYPQQVQTHHGPRLNQLQQPLRPQMPQISGVQQTAPVVQHQAPLVSQTPSAPHVPQPFSSGQVADFVPLAAKLEASAPNVDKVNPTTEATPQDIPAKPVAAASVQISKTPSPTSPAEEPIFPEQPEPTVIDSKSNVNQASKDTIPSFEETHNPDDGSKEESSLGASQVAKDGKKNKKSKKDINRKEIVGTEMDAFIDKSTHNPWKLFPGQVKPLANPWKLETQVHSSGHHFNQNNSHMQSRQPPVGDDLHTCHGDISNSSWEMNQPMYLAFNTSGLSSGNGINSNIELASRSSAAVVSCVNYSIRNDATKSANVVVEIGVQLVESLSVSHKILSTAGALNLIQISKTPNSLSTEVDKEVGKGCIDKSIAHTTGSRNTCKNAPLEKNKIVPHGLAKTQAQIQQSKKQANEDKGAIAERPYCEVSESIVDIQKNAGQHLENAPVGSSTLTPIEVFEKQRELMLKDHKPEDREKLSSCMKNKDKDKHSQQVSTEKSAVPAQVESKHKLKKKKKKKGRKTPPIQKTKQGTSNENYEASIQTSSKASEASRFEDKENEESASKPPLPPGAGDRKGSLDKTMTQETKAVINSTPEATKEVVREASPQPPVLTDTAPAQPIKINDKLSISEPERVSPVSVQDTQSISQIIQEAPNQNQSLGEQPGSSIRNKKPPGQQAERQNSQPFDNGMHTDKVNKSNDLESDSLSVNHVTVSEENEVETDVLNKAKVDDVKKGGLIEDNIITSKSVSEKTPLKGKKDGKDKLIYDRAHLMELRECPASQAKPEGLPNLEIILDRPNNNTTRSTTDAPDFTPGFFQQATSNNQRHTPQIGKTSSRGRQRPGDVQQLRIIKSVSLQNDVKPLHQSEKPWKPKEKQLSAGESAENRKSLESEVLFIMNRLTPTNFERLATEMRKLNIQTYEDLQELVKIFFDKVTMETKFVEAYALLCKVMSGLKVPPPPGMKDNQATFRVVMLTKCQQEFEADKSIIFEDPEEKKRKIESEMPEGNERNQLIETTLYLMKLKRLKFYGNIRFIGELFKLGMLTENIMHDCIYRLLKARDDDSLVSLCQLLTTVGHALDTDKAKTRMDQYFHQMAKIAEERKSRIKFTLKDAIDLRSNNWVPRKEQTGPKKIDEVHKDFQQEQFTKQLMQSQPLPPRNDQAQPNSRRGSRQRQDEIKQPLDDGWNTVGSKSLRIDASKMKLSKNVVDENSIQLGPGGGASKFSMWGRGSLGAQQLSQDDRPAPAANRFSLLRGGEEDRRNFQRSPSRGDSVANRGVRQGPTAGHGRGKILSRSSTEGERKEALANARTIVGGRSQNSSRDNSWNREEHRQFLGPRGSREGDNVMTRSDITLRPGRDSLLPPNVSPASVASTGGYDNEPIVKKLKPLSVDEMEQKAKTILEEYLSVKDLEEAKLCLRELEGQTHLDVLVSACINNVLEKTKRERELTGQFFHEMVKNKLIPLELYLKGLTEVLQYGEDMVIDIPMIWAYLAELIAPLLIGGSVPLLNLSQALQSNLERKCCAKLLVEILIIAKEKTSDSELAQMWQSSGLSWSGFIDEADIDKFLQDKKLTCTVAPLSAANISSRGVGSSKFDFDRVVKDIEKIAKDGGSSKDVITFVEKNIPVDSRDKDFIRALTTAIASASITPAMKANEDMIKNHKDTLHNYIKSNQELELQALYAIQALMHRLEHPSGVIVSLFEVLYDEEVISEEACKRWEKSTDPLEAEGKGACSMQLTHFFAWLRENDEPDASS